MYPQSMHFTLPPSATTLPPHLLHCVNKTPSSGSLMVACITPFSKQIIFIMIISLTLARILFFAPFAWHMHSRRSEERRVGKECSCRCLLYDYNKIDNIGVDLY